MAGDAASTPCATPVNGCYAIFAKDSGCSNNGITGEPPIVGGGGTITGGVQSNGNVSAGWRWVTSFGPTWLREGLSTPACSWTNGGFSNTFSLGTNDLLRSPPGQSTTATDFPSCRGAGPAPARTDTPSFCTHGHHRNIDSEPYTPDARVTSIATSASRHGEQPVHLEWRDHIVGSGGSLVKATFVGGQALTIVGGGFDLSACGGLGLHGVGMQCGGPHARPRTTIRCSTPSVAGTASIGLIGRREQLPSGDVFALNGTIS